jgi:hypothetical protein
MTDITTTASDIRLSATVAFIRREIRPYVYRCRALGSERWEYLICPTGTASELARERLEQIHGELKKFERAVQKTQGTMSEGLPSMHRELDIRTSCSNHST